ncbi:hypothetical protein NPIL_532451 [Nephila pilipes]|uniref:Uncharacterized protein n=1 Tax=Nephila pilipes TaxID=299642 RepID=A0A8X6P6Y4_NEPPI|nr:hypothetical protein NPIL_532451 [Nephila pilipes]
MAETKWISSSSEVKSVRRIFLSTVRDQITVWLQENGKHFPNEFLMISGGLKVYVRPESQVFGELPATWVTFGDQGNQWYRGNVSIPQFSESFQNVSRSFRGPLYITYIFSPEYRHRTRYNSRFPTAITAEFPLLHKRPNQTS